MMTTESFKDFILDQLSDIPELRSKRMFSGYGLYSGKNFFAIISLDRVYFKTTIVTRDRYIKEGMKPFAPNKTQVLKNYYEVSVEVMENRDQFSAWAEEAITIPLEKQNL